MRATHILLVALLALGGYSAHAACVWHIDASPTLTASTKEAACNRGCEPFTHVALPGTCVENLVGNWCTVSYDYDNNGTTQTTYHEFFMVNNGHEACSAPQCDTPCQQGQQVGRSITTIGIGKDGNPCACSDTIINGCESNCVDAVWNGISRCTYYYQYTGSGCEDPDGEDGNNGEVGGQPGQGEVDCPPGSTCQWIVQPLPPYYIPEPGQPNNPPPSSGPGGASPGGITPDAGDDLAGGYEGEPGSHTETMPTPGEEYTTSWGPFPSLPAGGWYTKRYTTPSQVYASKMAEMQSSGLFGLLSVFTVPGGIGSIPTWELNLNIPGMANLGVHEIAIPGWLWDVAKWIILITALITARKLIFGG